MIGEVAEIKNANQIIGISCSSASILLGLIFNTRGFERDNLMLFLLIISIGLLCGYLFWGSFKNEDWQWGYMGTSIVILGLIFYRIKSLYGIECFANGYRRVGG